MFSCARLARLLLCTDTPTRNYLVLEVGSGVQRAHVHLRIRRHHLEFSDRLLKSEQQSLGLSTDEPLGSARLPLDVYIQWADLPFLQERCLRGQPADRGNQFKSRLGDFRLS